MPKSGMALKNAQFQKMPLDELIRLRSTVGKVLAQRIETEQRALEARLAQLQKANVVTFPNNLFHSVPQNARRRKGDILYANPDDPYDVWSGRGRRPFWLVAEIKKGKKLTDFQVDIPFSPAPGGIVSEQEEMEAQLTRLQSAAGLANQAPRRGIKLPAKYRNPNNPSETWAGRGKLPRWMKAAMKAGKKMSDFEIVHRETDRTDRTDRQRRRRRLGTR